MNRFFDRALALTLTIGGLGCSDPLSDFADFIGDDFGNISDEVRDLDEAQLEALMAELMLRFRSYLALRQAIPLEALAPEECVTSSSGGATFTFVADVGCTFDADPALGEISVSQQQLADGAVSVFRFDLDYREVTVDDVEVHGTERITETDASDGASVRKLDLTQNGIALDYEFRAGLVDGVTPVFDYQLPGPGGDVIARITNPTSAGGFVSVFLTGLDGTLACEIRDSAWSVDVLPRGSCDNGVVFGLPDD